MRQLFNFFFLAIIGTAHAESVIMKSPTRLASHHMSSNGCSYNLLNPNLGADIYEVNCRSSQNFVNAEKSSIWKIFTNSNKSVIEVKDPMFNDQWGLGLININSFWQNHTTGDRRIKVAVIDSGLNYHHEDLQANLDTNTKEIPNNEIDDDSNGYIDDYYGWDAANNSSDPMDNFDHGTHVSGIIGASSNNDIGIVGMNWNVSLIPIRFVDNQAGGRTEAAIRAIDYAVARGAKIINVSWGGTTHSPLLEEMMNRCKDKGILIIAAAGNESVNNDITPTWPASFALDNIISVAAINLHKELAWFSNWGAKSVHISAPGESILSTTGGNRYGFKDGTSMAVPHITGAAALIWAAHPNWNYLEIKNYILNHCVTDGPSKIPVLCQGHFSFAR